MTPDRFTRSGEARKPQTWNRYAYGNGDPANNNDPSGLDVDCGVLDGEFVCVDDIWGELNGPAYPNPPASSFGTLYFDQWLWNYLHAAANSLLTVKKSYQDIQPCSLTATQAIYSIENNFAAFANFTTTGPMGVGESVTFNPPAGPLTVGESIPITVLAGGSTLNTSVIVTSVTQTSFSFETVPGHLLYPASISFSATQLNTGGFYFNIYLTGLINGAANVVKFLAGGSSFENAEWNNFLNQISVSLCGSELPSSGG